MPVPNKTIYVSDGDLPLYARAQELAGGNLSSAIAKALHRWVDVAEGLSEGYEDVTVRVGLGNGRNVRFTGVLVGEWTDATPSSLARYRVYQGRTGKYVMHVERSPEFVMVDGEGKPAGWKGYLGIGNIKYGESPKVATLEVVDILDGLRDKVPPELFAMVERASRQPSVEELDI